jgi:cytochrome d ubiquinol oxidase subunit I
MDPLSLARWQFAITTVYHFFFVPLTLGLAWMIVLMETIYVSTRNDVYRDMAKFWGKLFLINFAMGVVTGIVQEFQFGMNWSDYSRFVGDVFGAPLAIEALLAFFLESTFLGIWIFGWDRLSSRAHLVAIWMVAIGSTISALWILIANSFMQQPVGYVLANGRAEMVDFAALVLNPNVWVQFPHVITAGLVTAGFFLMGVSAWHLWRQSHPAVFRRSFQIGATVGLIGIVLTILNGHSQAQHMVETQPMKMAAAEGLFTSEDPASFSLLTIGDPSGTREVFSVRVPNLLSLMAYNQLKGEVQGINDLQAAYRAQFGPGDYVPPAWIVYWSFRAMVGAAFLMLALAGYGLFLSMAEVLEKRPRLLRLFLWGMFLPYIANTTGWLMAEVGRFPWTVYGVLKIADSVTPTNSLPMVLATLVGFTAVYGGLLVVTVGLLRRFGRDLTPAESTAPETGAPGLLGAA